MVIETQFIKMLTYIAYGLREKLQVKENNSYPRSLIFRQGINIFSYLMVAKSGFNDEKLKIKLNHLNETDFFLHYLQYPISNWFNEWDEANIKDIINNPLYKMNAFIELYNETRTFVLTEDCRDFLSSVESDLPAIDEHAVYNRLKDLSQNDYVIRRHQMFKELPHRDGLCLMSKIFMLMCMVVAKNMVIL